MKTIHIKKLNTYLNADHIIAVCYGSGIEGWWIDIEVSKAASGNNQIVPRIWYDTKEEYKEVLALLLKANDD